MRAQAKLLQVTETPAVDRLGGQHSIPVDFRLIVATNQNLEDMIRDGKFRSDLYYRLNMDMIRTPPLRERLDDIPLLVDYFIGCYVADARRLVTGAAPQVIDLLQQYSWPGNIRELQNVIRKAVFKGKNEVIRLEDLPFEFGQKTAAPPITLGNYQGADAGAFMQARRRRIESLSGRSYAGGKVTRSQPLPVLRSGQNPRFGCKTRQQWSGTGVVRMTYWKIQASRRQARSSTTKCKLVVEARVFDDQMQSARRQARSTTTKSKLCRRQARSTTTKSNIGRRQARASTTKSNIGRRQARATTTKSNIGRRQCARRLRRPNPILVVDARVLRRPNPILSSARASFDDQMQSCRRQARPSTTKCNLVVDSAASLRRRKCNLLVDEVKGRTRMHSSGVQFGLAQGLLQLCGEEVLLSDQLTGNDFRSKPDGTSTAAARRFKATFSSISPSAPRRTPWNTDTPAAGSSFRPFHGTEPDNVLHALPDGRARRPRAQRAAPAADEPGFLERIRRASSGRSNHTRQERR